MIFSKGKIGQLADEFFTAQLSLIILVARTLTIVSQTPWCKRLQAAKHTSIAKKGSYL